MNKPKGNVVAAVIKDGDRYLCLQRTRSRYDYISERWEFPGGKMEKEETEHEALLREIKEEMDWDIFVGRRLGSVEQDYPDYTITLTAYLCRGTEAPFKLLSHLDAKWLTRDKMDVLKWTEADNKLIKELQL